MIGDDAPPGMKNGVHPLQWEPFVASDVEKGRQCAGSLGAAVRISENASSGSRRQREIR